MDNAATSRQPRRPFLLYHNTAWPFKKHNGLLLEEVLRIDLNYVKWMYKEKYIDFDPAAWNMFQDARGEISDRHQVKTLGNAFGRGHKKRK